jgi:ppGpp synthetase/RelA/SpoT-type nucleotidyltranferase
VTALNDARVRWLEEHDRYQAFGEVIAASMKEGVRALGLWCETSSRAKELPSLIKKLIRKPHYSYETLPDKVGARCIIRYHGDLVRVVEVAQARFVCSEIESKADKLGVEKIGYLSIHIDVSLRGDDPLAATYAGMRAELQIRTLAQHLWSEMSHDSVYKNDEAFSKQPDSLKRRVNLMAGIIEVADMEFNRLNGELKQRPEVEVYQRLEAHFYKLTAHSSDPALSLDVISLLLPLYQGASVSAIAERVDAYVAEHEPGLHDIYAEQEEHLTSELIFQPEALMIAEFLAHNEPTALRTLWSTKFPDSELEKLALAFGHSFD